MVALAAFALALQATSALAATITPVTGKPNLIIGNYDLGKLNYVVEEYFVAGDATAFKPARELTSDGKWTLTEAGKAPFKTRVVVIRPRDGAKTNGTALVEWLNVSAGGDIPPDWLLTHRELIRSGYTYVAVSAQKVGIDGGVDFGFGVKGLKIADPQRYASLNHPGDAYSFDIFSQVAKALRAGEFKGVKPKTILAAGESQSAGYMSTYVDGIDPISKAFDGYLIHSRGASASKLGPDVTMPPAAQLRSDMRAPVLLMETETDVPGYFPARVPDSDKIRVWETPGTSHGDLYMNFIGPDDDGSMTPEALAKAFKATNQYMGKSLPKPFNNSPQHHYVLSAAVSALNAWVTKGTPPAKAEPMAFNGATKEYSRDKNGLALGGVRTPWMDVPTSTLSGLPQFSGPNQPGEGFVRLIGSAEPYDQAKLDQLYPGGKAEYLKKFDASLAATVKAGFMLPADAKESHDLAAAMYQGR